jgi:uncharacterized iron-regulated membrane protein
MFRFFRQSHKLIGLTAAIFLVFIASSGFLLALKGNVPWMRPAEAAAEKVSDPLEIVPVATVLDSVFALKNENLRGIKDVDRVYYRPKSNIFKVVSKEGYQEVQVDGKTARVLSISFRTDQLTEDVHDLSIVSDKLKTYGLPLVALSLLSLAISGVIMYTIPVVRRWKCMRERSEKSSFKD